MKLRLFVLSILVAAVLPACMDSPVQPQCSPVNPQIQSQAGDTIVLTTGLRYLVTTASSHELQLQSCRRALVDLDLYVADELVITTRDRDPEEILPGTGWLIPGLEQGVVGMRVEEVRRLIIPPALGYGSQTVRNEVTGEVLIPPNSTLVVDVTVVAVEL